MVGSSIFLSGLLVILLNLICSIQRTVSISCDLNPSNTEGRLRKQLLCKYDKDLIPTVDKKHPVLISLTLAVKSFNFHDDENVLEISSWMPMFWKDAFLKWNPREYDNITSIVVFSDDLWQPDLGIFNSDVASAESEFCKATSCLIDSNGTVACVPPCLHEAFCRSNYRRWPFDTQNCTMHIGTWLNDGSEIDFELKESYIPVSATRSQNREWRMRQSTYRVIKNAVVNGTYPTLAFSFQLDRHSAGHAAMMLGPALVIVIINLVSLWLAPACVERLSLVCLNIFFHFTYLQQLSWYVPSNGDVCPLFIIFFEISLWLTVVLLLTAVVLRGLSQCQLSAPAWVKSSMDYMESVKVGQFCLKQDYLVESQPFHNDSLPEETVESHALGTSDKPKLWEIVAKVIDRMLFVVLLVVYVAMIIELIPEGYLTDAKDADLKIIKY